MFKEEQLNKLTTTLAGEIELYNDILKHEQEQSEAIIKAQEEANLIKNKLTESETREQKYLGQISNLLSRIPVGEPSQKASLEQQIQAIKDSKWTK